MPPHFLVTHKACQARAQKNSKMAIRHKHQPAKCP